MEELKKCRLCGHMPNEYHNGLSVRCGKVSCVMSSIDMGRHKWQELMGDSVSRQPSDLEAELQEQARLLGMSGSREAALLARIADLEKREEGLREALAGAERILVRLDTLRHIDPNFQELSSVRLALLDATQIVGSHLLEEK